MVEKDSQEDQGSLGGTDQVDVHAVQGQGIVQHTQKQRAAQHADGFAHASVEAAATQDRACESHHDQPRAHVVGDRVLSPCCDQSRDGGEETGKHKGIDHDPLGMDAGNKGRAAVSACQEETPARRRLAEDKFKHRIDQHKREDCNLKRSDPAAPQPGVKGIELCQ